MHSFLMVNHEIQQVNLSFKEHRTNISYKLISSIGRESDSAISLLFVKKNRLFSLNLGSYRERGGGGEKYWIYQSFKKSDCM